MYIYLFWISYVALLCKGISIIKIYAVSCGFIHPNTIAAKAPPARVLPR